MYFFCLVHFTFKLVLLKQKWIFISFFYKTDATSKRKVLQRQEKHQRQEQTIDTLYLNLISGGKKTQQKCPHLHYSTAHERSNVNFKTYWNNTQFACKMTTF